MSEPLVQLAALGTASAMGALSLFLHYGHTHAQPQPQPQPPTGSDLELGIVTHAKDGQEPHICQGHQPEGAQEIVSPIGNAGRSPSMVFGEPSEPSETLKL